MADPTGSIGHYSLGPLLGEGGMGRVYRATDTKLHRDVALKLLPDAFSDDPERLERLRREARALASLSHPNIGAIHGIEERDGRVALVLELIEGPTLADRIERGPLGLDEALPIARQIAAALESAHERGIVHRDLKPANIKIAPDGQVKVLDFGLARSVERAAAADAGVTHSPTLTMTTAIPGMILGTAAYMSPEQAKGEPVDRRADLWAFGAVLFEMLTGNRLFQGNSLTEVLAAVISTEPDLSRLPRSVPDWLRDLMMRCLRRDVTMRLPDAAAARIALIEGASAAPATREKTGRGLSWGAMAAGVTVGLVLGAFVMRLAGGSAPAPAAPTTYTELVLDPPPLPDAPPALSPDGTRIAYTGGDDDRSVMIYLRDLTAGGTTALPGSEHGMFPAFSPDGRSIAFFSGGRLWVTSLQGTLPASITPASGGVDGITWQPDDTIIYATQGYRVPHRIPASGGTATPLAVDLPGAEGLWVSDPSPLPDPDQILVSFRSATDGPRIGILSLRDGALTPIVRGSNPRFVEPASLVFLQRGTLLTAPIDLRTRTLTGAERSVDVPGVTLVTMNRSAGDFAVAGTQRSGLALFPLGKPEARALVWVDRDGRETPTGFVFDSGPGMAWAANGSLGASLSPDGTRVALIADGAPLVIDLDDVDTRRKLPKPGSAIAYPHWDPTGEQIVVLGNLSGSFQGYLMPASGEGTPVPVSNLQQSIALSFFPDGKSILGYVVTAETSRDLWVFGLDGNDTPLLQTPANERAPQVAPSGKAFAYVSDESGEDRIYLRLYPDVGRAWTISGDGATEISWSHDGRELFFRQGVWMMAVSVDLSDGVRIGTPRPLFPASAYEQDPFGIAMYDVADDGRFLMVRRGNGARTWRFIRDWGTTLAELASPR